MAMAPPLSRMREPGSRRCRSSMALNVPSHTTASDAAIRREPLTLRASRELSRP